MSKGPTGWSPTSNLPGVLKLPYATTRQDGGDYAVIDMQTNAVCEIFHGEEARSWAAVHAGELNTIWSDGFAACSAVGWRELGKHPIASTTGGLFLWRADWVNEDFNRTGILSGHFQEGGPGKAHFNVVNFTPDQGLYFSRLIYNPAEWPTHWRDVWSIIPPAPNAE